MKNRDMGWHERMAEDAAKSAKRSKGDPQAQEHYHKRAAMLYRDAAERAHETDKARLLEAAKNHEREASAVASASSGKKKEGGSGQGDSYFASCERDDQGHCLPGKSLAQTEVIVRKWFSGLDEPSRKMLMMAAGRRGTKKMGATAFSWIIKGYVNAAKSKKNDRRGKEQSP